MVNAEIWTLWNCKLWWKEKRVTFGSFYSRNEKWRGRNPAQILKVRPELLDVWSITLSKAFNDVVRVPKRQKLSWNGKNDPSICLGSKNPCGLSCNYGYTSKLYFFSSDEKKKLEFWGAIVGAKTWAFALGLKSHSLIIMRLRRRKHGERPRNR